MLLIRNFFAAVTLSLLLAGTAIASGTVFPWRQAPQFLDVENVLQQADVLRDAAKLVVSMEIAPDYYVYRPSLKVVNATGEAVAMELPPGTIKHDEFFGETQVFYANDLRIELPASTPANAVLHWQGCAEAGICYPPQQLALRLPLVASSTSISLPSETQQAIQLSPSPQPMSLAADQATAQKLASLHPVIGVLLFFGFGVLLAFTPCTLPMIPIVASMVVGKQTTTARALVLLGSYVLTMAVTYSVVGVAAGLAGSNWYAALQSPWILGAFAGLFVLLASTLFGLFELRLPAWLLNRVDVVSRKHAGGSITGSAALGLLSALLVGPCMTAPLAGALLYISQTGSALLGGLALFALGLGMGLPLLGLALFGNKVLPKPGPWMECVRVVFGYVMLGVAISMLDRFMPAQWMLAIWGGWLLAVAIGLLAWSKNVIPRTERAGWFLRYMSVLTGIWALLLLVGSASGATSIQQPLEKLCAVTAVSAPPNSQQPTYIAAKTVENVNNLLRVAQAQGKWTLIDFFAEWCASCHVIEKNVFGNPEVATRLEHLQIIRPDVTRNDAEDKALLKHWGVQGPPTLILVAPDGTERRDLRMVGELSATDFLQTLDTAGTP